MWYNIARLLELTVGMILFILAIIENMMEFRPEMSSEAAQQGLLQYLLKRIKVRSSYQLHLFQTFLEIIE